MFFVADFAFKEGGIFASANEVLHFKCARDDVVSIVFDECAEHEEVVIGFPVFDER